MASKKNICISFMFLLTVLCGCGGNNEKSRCTSSDACMNDANCSCWCSQKCVYRNKNASDHPVYVKNDPNGKSCYCKQWDLDNYEDNCKLHKNVKEPAGAK